MRGRSLSALLRKDALEQLKTYRIWIVLAVFLFFGITAPVLTKNLPKLIPKTEQFTIIMKEMTIRDAAQQYFSYVLQMGMLLVILLGMGAVAGERAHGVLPLVLSKPVRRRDFLLSKLTVNGAILGGGLLVGTAVFYGYTVLVFQYFSPGGTMLSLIPTAAFLWFVLALTVFWSTIAPSSIAAGGLSFLSALVLTIVPSVIPAVKRFGPAYIAEIGKSLVAGQVGLGDVLASLVVTCVLIAACVVGALHLFSHRDI